MQVSYGGPGAGAAAAAQVEPGSSHKHIQIEQMWLLQNDKRRSAQKPSPTDRDQGPVSNKRVDPQPVHTGHVHGAPKLQGLTRSVFLAAEFFVFLSHAAARSRPKFWFELL